MKNSIDLIREERIRQIDKEGFLFDHDAKNTNGELAAAAACYAMPATDRRKYQSYAIGHGWYPRWWPKNWEVRWWKPSPNDRVKELVKAGALIAAEIDRLLLVKK